MQSLGSWIRPPTHALWLTVLVSGCASGPPKLGEPVPARRPTWGSLPTCPDAPAQSVRAEVVCYERRMTSCMGKQDRWLIPALRAQDSHPVCSQGPFHVTPQDPSASAEPYDPRTDRLCCYTLMYEASL